MIQTILENHNRVLLIRNFLLSITIIIKTDFFFVAKCLYRYKEKDSNKPAITCLVCIVMNENRGWHMFKKMNVLFYHSSFIDLDDNNYDDSLKDVNDLDDNNYDDDLNVSS